MGNCRSDLFATQFHIIASFHVHPGGKATVDGNLDTCTRWQRDVFDYIFFCFFSQASPFTSEGRFSPKSNDTTPSRLIFWRNEQEERAAKTHPGTKWMLTNNTHTHGHAHTHTYTSITIRRWMPFPAGSGPVSPYFPTASHVFTFQLSTRMRLLPFTHVA